MLSSSRQQPSFPNLYPQLSAGQAPGAMQPYNPGAAGPSQPVQPFQSNPLAQPLGQFTGGYGTGGGLVGAQQQQQLYQPNLGHNTLGQGAPYLPAQSQLFGYGNQLQAQQQGQTQYQQYPNQIQQQSQQQQGQGQGQSVGQSQPQSSANRPYQPAASTSLLPQPVENVQGEHPLYGPLGRAKAKVERAMRADEEISPDLADMLNVQTNDPYAPPPGSSNSAFRPLRIEKSTALPDALHQELNYKHQTAKMGLFEAIERAWFTVDNKLFLWNYADGRDFSRYDEQADTIQAVGLVQARKDVFVDEISYVLIICTSTKATLLGLSRGSKPPKEINLYETQLSVSLPTSMLSISGTHAGRIFMLGADKDLYELEYSSNSGWFYGSSTSVKLTNRTSGALANWVPSILSGSTKEGVESFAVDPQQNRLFLLRSKDEIEVVNVAGNDWIVKSRCTNFKNHLPREQGQAPDVKGNRVVRIVSVGQEESRRICLVAILANGFRVYFTMDSYSFQPAFLRKPPYQGLNLSSQTFYSSGTFLGIQHDSSGPTPSTTLITCVPNVGRHSVARENYDNFDAPIYQDWLTQDTIASQVWTVVELPSPSPAMAANTAKRSDGIVLNPLSRQANDGARQFLILATSGLFSARMPRPVDMLRGEVEVEKDTAITVAKNHFGKVQTAAMAVLLGAGNKNPADLNSAISSILLGAGAPVVKDTSTGRFIHYSGRHDGLALTFSRFLRPIWLTRVVAPGSSGRLVLAAPEGALDEVQKNLLGLAAYIDANPLLPQYQAEGDTKVAWEQEKNSLEALSVLVKQSIEAISFVILLVDSSISDIIAKCAPAVQQSLASLTYQALVTTEDGRKIAKVLVTSLIEQQIVQERSIEEISTKLQQQCGSFCPPGDVVMYKAEESIRRAESSRDAQDQREFLNESLRLFSKAAATVGVSRLQDVAKRYRGLNFTIGAIELPLRCAADSDPDDKASDYVRDGEHPSDPRKEKYTARMEYYACVIEALGSFDEALDKATATGNPGPIGQQRDEAYSLAIASDDELFHFYLYDWHVARHLSEQLLQFDTPYIEKYLQITSSGVEERRDLLWKYYARSEEYLAASKALFELATRNSALPLHDRAYYLAQSLTSAKSAGSVGAEEVEFTSGLQERIDVAQVQMEVARAIESHMELSKDEKAEALGRLDSDLIGLDELYQGFARPYRLYEPILLILKTADTRIDDVCEAVWRQLLQSAAATSQGQSIGVDARVGEVIRDLSRRFFPSEAAPLDIFLPVVYGETSQIPGPPGWASQALLDGRVPLRDLWEAVMSLIEESDDRSFLTEEAGVLAEHWTRSREQIPAAEVERFASAYLLRTSSGDVDERTRRTRERMNAAKTAAGRY